MQIIKREKRVKFSIGYQEQVLQYTSFNQLNKPMYTSTFVNTHIRRERRKKFEKNPIKYRDFEIREIETEE